ncbi:MAG: RidA family protein [Pseudomonadota bacterium]
MRVLDPDDVVKPASNYAQGIEHAAGARRIVVSGQLGVHPDGTVADGLEAQMEQAFENVFGVLRAGGLGRESLIRLTIYVTQSGQVAVYRRVRDKMMAGHLCANTYLEISGLATPDFLVEIEAEAIGP